MWHYVETGLAVVVVCGAGVGAGWLAGAVGLPALLAVVVGMVAAVAAARVWNRFFDTSEPLEGWDR